MRKKAFTLMELLVVVIVVAVLASVSIPKFTRVLETRRTDEAERVLGAVRTEQEARCVMGKNYLGEERRGDLAVLKNADQSQNYQYSLGEGLIEAKRGTDYTLKMYYKTGEMCCEGTGCSALNKNYPACSSQAVYNDECIGNTTPPEKPEPTCADPDYAAANPCICYPNTCSCPEYRAANPCVCEPEKHQDLCNPKKDCSGDTEFLNKLQDGKYWKYGGDKCSECIWFDYECDTSTGKYDIVGTGHKDSACIKECCDSGKANENAYSCCSSPNQSSKCCAEAHGTWKEAQWEWRKSANKTVAYVSGVANGGGICPWYSLDGFPWSELDNHSWEKSKIVEQIIRNTPWCPGSPSQGASCDIRDTGENPNCVVANELRYRCESGAADVYGPIWTCTQTRDTYCELPPYHSGN